MAYIPDSAFRDAEEIGQKAFLLYCFYCKHGSMANNVVCVGLDRAAKFLNLSYENTCRLSAKLKKYGWLKHQNGLIFLLKGYENLSKTAENSSQKLTKTAVFENNLSLETAENSSFDDEKLLKTAVSNENLDLKTDENSSFESQKLLKTAVYADPSISKTAENSSQKLLKTAVAYKEEPASFNQQEKTKAKSAASDDAESVFEFWKNALNHPNARLDNKRRKRIQTRLADGFSAEELKSAVCGVLCSPFHLGENDRQTRYDGIETIFRDRAQVEKFIALAAEPEKPKSSGIWANVPVYKDSYEPTPEEIAKFVAFEDQMRQQQLELPRNPPKLTPEETAEFERAKSKFIADIKNNSPYQNSAGVIV